MKFRDANGNWKNYPHSFTEADKERLESFLGTHNVVCPMKELEAHIGGFDSDVVSIRHDVDHSLEHAMKFAAWEHERGIRASYFVLHTAYYYNNRVILYKWLKQLVEMGHEVGLHLDTVSQNLQVDGKPNYPAAAEQLHIELSELRNAGFDIVGAAVHGGHDKYTDEILISMYGRAFFDLQYEAYELQRRLEVNYISDNRGQWRAPLVKIPHRATVMLLHPCHWPFA